MKLFVNLDTRQIISSPRARVPLKEIRARRGEAITIDVAFVTHGKQVPISADTIQVVAYKGPAERTALVSATAYEFIKSEAVYRFSIVYFGGSGLLALLGNQQDTTLVFEILAHVGNEYIATEPLKLVVTQSTQNYTSIVPVDAGISTVRWYPQIDSLLDADVGSSPLSGIVTVSLSVRTIAQICINNEIQDWLLKAGTDAPVVMGVVHPNDYNSSTNAKVWIRLR